MTKYIPNSFQTPNAFVDDLLSQVSGNAVKCYLIITRKTTGWQKTKDNISVSQIKEISGIKRNETIYSAIDELLHLNIINKVINKSKGNSYSINYDVVLNFSSTEKQDIMENCSSVVRKNRSTVVRKNRSTVVRKNRSTCSTEKPYIQNTLINTNKHTNKHTNKNKQKKADKSDLCRSVLAYFNEKTGKNLSAIESNIKNIKVRLNEHDYTLEDFKHVIDVKYAEWVNDIKMAKYIQPSTIFGNKFDQYLNQDIDKVKQAMDNGLISKYVAKNGNDMHSFLQRDKTTDNLGISYE